MNILKKLLIAALILLLLLIVTILVLMIVYEEKPPESEFNWTQVIQKEYTGDEMVAADTCVESFAFNAQLTAVESHIDHEGVFTEVFHYYVPAQDGKPNGSIWIYIAPQKSVILSATAIYSEEEFAPAKLSLSEIESIRPLLSAKALSYLDRKDVVVSEVEYIIYAHSAEVRAYTQGEYDPNSPVNGKSFYDKEIYTIERDENGKYQILPTSE